MIIPDNNPNNPADISSIIQIFIYANAQLLSMYVSTTNFVICKYYGNLVKIKLKYWRYYDI